MSRLYNAHRDRLICICCDAGHAVLFVESLLFAAFGFASYQ